ncbi:MAG: arginine deiminase [Defluviitaleaceae bacterium]|nr:arginine deiminase [Defluviitaleaceae bacterium]MCL2240452.1 arginine deiminase [Defluviitaleaceae bacterium]
MHAPIRLQSEIGPLKSVIIKRPCTEIENLMPDYADTLLFDEIPYLPKMQTEHDAFAGVLTARGIEVLYLERLMAEALKTDSLKAQFLSKLLNESNHMHGYILEKMKEFLLRFDAGEMVARIMGGVRKDEPGLKIPPRRSLLAEVAHHYPFYVSPMPNLYFTRDLSACIGNGVVISKMNKKARQKESLFMQFIFENHDRFAGLDIPVWLNRDYPHSIEGGDVLVLSGEAIAIGISERTSAAAIEQLAKNLFAAKSGISKVLAVDIPKARACMHLDTVFTMLDRNKFTIHMDILDRHGEIDSYIIEESPCDAGIKIKPLKKIKEALMEILGTDEIEFIPCAGGDVIAGPREQWSDGSNTLAVAPGVVVTYERNYVTNKIFREHGLEVLEIPCSEVSRGRGGPRCMSLPLVRADV